jgi:hypothetical protein
VFDDLARRDQLTRIFRLALVLCAVVTAGLTLCDAQALAEEKPETPITETCMWPFESGRGLEMCGTLNPHTTARTGYFFEYNEGTSCSGRYTVSGEPGEPVEGEGVKVSAYTGGGLFGDTTYTYCLVATNSAGEATGGPVIFRTPGPQRPITEPCPEPFESGRGWELCGILNPQAAARTEYYFEYNEGTSCTGGYQIPGEAEGQDVKVSAYATGLHATTTYTYCLVATDYYGDAPGETVTFTTGPETPITEPCYGGPKQKSGEWELCGTLNPHATARNGSYFEYNEGTSCTGGARVPAGEEVEGQDVKVSAEATGLHAATTYAYCLVATDAEGEATGRTVIFTTPYLETPITESCLGACNTPSPQPTPTLLTAAPGNLVSPPPAPPPLSAPAPKHQTKAQKLTAALRKCHKYPKKRRVRCEKLVRRMYVTRAATVRKPPVSITHTAA